MSDYYKKPQFFEAGVVYETSYRLLRELWEPAYRAMKNDRKRALRQLRENHPLAYQNAFASFWENRRDMQKRRIWKELWHEEHVKEWRKTHHPWSMPPAPPPFSEGHIIAWLIEKGYVHAL